MVEANPYSAPGSEVAHEADEFGDPIVFSWNSRAGRLRYLARTMIMTVLGYLLVGIVVGAVVATNPSTTPDAIGGVLGLAYVIFILVSLVFGIMFVVQRLHDLDHSGWMSLIMLIPLANAIFGLYLLFARGTDGANRYGAEPPPNTVGVKLGALLLPLMIIVFGIMAAIAIPAYQDFVRRAQEAQTQTQ